MSFCTYSGFLKQPAGSDNYASGDGLLPIALQGLNVPIGLAWYAFTVIWQSHSYSLNPQQPDLCHRRRHFWLVLLPGRVL